MKPSRPRPALTPLLLVPAVAGFLVPPGPAAEPPLDLGPGQIEGTGINYASAAVTFPDGRLESYHRRAAEGRVSIFRSHSTDGARHWSAPQPLVALSVDPWGGPMPLLDRDGELHFIIPKVRGDGRKPAVDRFIDLYHVKSSRGRTAWSEPRRIFEGYCGALQGVFQLKSGRILAPFADWRPGVPTTPPTGPSETTLIYSDDGGATWRRSPARLTAPCFEGYNGANYGACEPTLIEREDGRVWMLIRTQAGSLYESFSPDGVDWSPARPSRFPSSNSPAFPLRLRDGRLVLFWNHTVMPPRAGKDGVYGGRDALHAALSADGGNTWRGFREVYRDPTRHQSPPTSGDRGTAYPHATLVDDGRILLVSGQGENLRRRFLIDPEWLLETRATADLSDLDDWHAFQGIGAAKRFWRDRRPSAEIVADPDRPGRPAMRLRRRDAEPGDGAGWNFPAGASGVLTLRLRLEPGGQGARVSLTDRYYDPTDERGDREAPFSVTLTAENGLQPGRWHEVTLTWAAEGPGRLSVDGAAATPVERRRGFPNGLSYLRLRSPASGIDPAGFLVGAASAEIAP